MNEKASSKNEKVETQDIGATLQKMQYQMDSIEGKLNSLMHQLKPIIAQGKNSLRSHKTFDGPKRSGERRYDRKKEEVASEGKFYHGLPFDKKKDSPKSSFKKRKKTSR